MARIARWGLAIALLALVAPMGATAQAFKPDQLTEMPQVKSASQFYVFCCLKFPRFGLSKIRRA